MHRIDLANSDVVVELKGCADLLTAFAYSWDKNKDKEVQSRNGSRVLQCFDFVSGDEKNITIPERFSTPVDYARSLYSDSRKIQRSVRTLEVLLKKIKMHLSYLDEIQSSLNLLNPVNRFDDMEALKEIAVEISEISKTVLLQGVEVELRGLQGDDSETGDDDEPKVRVQSKQKTAKSKSFSRKLKQELNRSKEKELAKKKNKEAGSSSKPTNAKILKKGLQGLLVVTVDPVLLEKSVERKNKNRNRNSYATDQIVGGDPDDITKNTAHKNPLLIVGRSSKQNDRISFEIARDHHLWFHVQVRY